MKTVHLQLKTSRLRCQGQGGKHGAEAAEAERECAMPTLSVATAATELAATFAGQVLQPADAGYDEARRVHNGLIDKRPALIGRCRGVADVVDLVNTTRNLGLELAVRGGGHNVAGRATIDGGVMIDLAPMKGIHVDPKARTVRAQGGVTWGELNRETQIHGLAVTGGVVSTTGIAGLTLGGGLGWLMGKFGLALDNLRSVEVVTANGKVLHASRDQEPDLFWAVRGGGGNFGVVTSFEYQLHPVGPTVMAGPIVHSIDRSRALLEFYRDRTKALADEHTLFATLAHAPDGSGREVAALVTCHCGTADEAEKAMRPLKQFSSPVMDGVGPMPYCQLNSMLDANYPKGALNYWKSNFLTELNDAAIGTMIDCFARCPTPMSQLLLEHIHGAAARVGVEDTAFPHRREGYNFLVLAQWLQPADTSRCVAWARDTYERMQPFFASGRYVNYLGDDEADASVAAAYGPNYRRLQRIKATYDPNNLFRMNQNIRPLA
jgi:FAD/FMN-containing dehydrogenase